MHTHALEQSDYLQLPPAPQEKKQSFSRVADRASIPPLRRKRASLSPPPKDKNLSDSVREFFLKTGTFPRKVHHRRPKSVRSSGPIGARESSRMQATYAHMTCPRELTYEGIQAHITCIHMSQGGSFKSWHHLLLSGSSD